MKIISINIGEKRTQQRINYVETTGIYKEPVAGSVEIKTLGIENDAICDTKHHGGPDQALYIYGSADYEWWSQELGKDIKPGTFGENITISELESTTFNVGDYLHIGSVTLQVTAPRIPCGTFATRMQDPQWVKLFTKAERPGLYVRVIKEGVIRDGDEIIVEKYTGETISVLEMYRENFVKKKSMESLQKHLRAPIDIRTRMDLEDEMQKVTQ